MVGNLFHGPTPWIVLFVVLLLFGAPKLPALARSLGQSMKILKKEVSTKEEEKAAAEAKEKGEAPDEPAQSAPAPQPPSADEELTKAKAEAEAAKAEAAALRAAAEQRAEKSE